MHPSARLFTQLPCRITFFTRSNCSLCINARQTLSNVWDTRPFFYKEIDVMTPEGKLWKDLYEFDTPVIHVRSSAKEEESPYLASKAVKLMHRFTEEEVKSKMDVAENETT
ncbi:glutaredoxin domain-containing protein [Calycina marina]|uniref:Glutaredoxin-like protein n=1 Tax=Calycina marina TaxID=1763456 RepID=A0A9P8CGK1_9HELO|nr:glutaredoxin domain-containing protein [Calycina marina]